MKQAQTRHRLLDLPLLMYGFWVIFTIMRVYWVLYHHASASTVYATTAYRSGIALAGQEPGGMASLVIHPH